MRYHEVVERLDETVFGKLAIGYHRTKNVNGTKAIGTTGFKAGGGATYGKGIYLTYSFEDQQDDRMKETYGPYIIRAKVNLEGFLIFDPDVAKTVYGIECENEDGSYDATKLLTPQFVKLGLPTADIAEIARRNLQNSSITSYGAKVAASKYEGIPKVKGLVFTGASDGRVIVAYDASRVIPYGWARVINHEKTRETVKWNKFMVPPTSQQVEQRMPRIEIATRYLKRQGFREIEGRPGARTTMVGVVAEDFLIVKLSTVGLTGVQTSELHIKAECMRNDPYGDHTHLGSARPQQVRIYYHSAKGEADMPKVVRDIMTNHSAMKDRASAAETLARSLAAMLVQTGTPVTGGMQPGADYGQDRVRMQAGPVMILLDTPYDDFVHGQVNVGVDGLDLELVFNDGSARGGTGSVEKAYKHLTDTARFESRIWSSILKTRSLPRELSDTFRDDLMQVFK